MVANPALTGFTAPKLLWVRKHEPANWDRVRQVLLPKDYIRYRLTGHLRHRGQRRLGHAAARRRQPPLEPRAARQARPRPGAPAPLLREPRGLGRGERDRVGGDRACRRGRRSSAAAATSRPARWATGSSGRAWSRPRWGPPASSSPTPTSSASTPWAASSAAATRCRAPGTSWASCSSAGGSFQWFRNELGKAEVDAGQAAGRRPLLPAHRRGRARRPRGRGAVLPALPDRRADPALRPRRQGGLDRPDRPPRPAAPDPQPCSKGRPSPCATAWS